MRHPGKELPPSANIIRAISKAGFCSRKQALLLVQAGRVKACGRTITDPGYRIGNPAALTIDDRPIPSKKCCYIALHKPAGYVTTRSDEHGRQTVYELLGTIGQWVFPVGRLDRASEGLLLLTNDTDFGNYLTDPQNRIARTYHVLIEGDLPESDRQRILAGVAIGRGEISRPIHLKKISQSGRSTWLEITLTEGKNREIRRLFEALGSHVTRLIRTRFGPYELGDLKPGHLVEVTKRDMPAKA